MEQGFPAGKLGFFTSCLLLLNVSKRRSANWPCQIALPPQAAVGLVAFASKSPAPETLEANAVRDAYSELV